MAEVLRDFPAFLADHAACERKAVALCLSLTVRYPAKTKLTEPLLALAKEELEHFHQVTKLLLERDLTLTPDRKDPYISTIQRAMRDGRETRLLDTLVASSLIEARGAERFQLLAEALTEESLKQFYHRLAKSEQAHHLVFLRLAKLYYDGSAIGAAVEKFLTIESEAMLQAPKGPTLH